MNVSSTHDTTSQQPFNRAVIRKRRDRASQCFANHDFLTAEFADRLVDRLDDLKLCFTDVAVLGAPDGKLGRIIAERPDVESVQGAAPSLQRGQNCTAPVAMPPRPSRALRPLHARRGQRLQDIGG